MKYIREIATAWDVTPSRILQSRAMLILFPQLEEKINRREISQEKTQETVCLAFDSLVLQAIKNREVTGKPLVF